MSEKSERKTQSTFLPLRKLYATGKTQNTELTFCVALATGKDIPSQRKTGIFIADAPPPDIELSAVATRVTKKTITAVSTLLSIYQPNARTSPSNPSRFIFPQYHFLQRTALCKLPELRFGVDADAVRLERLVVGPRKKRDVRYRQRE